MNYQINLNMFQGGGGNRGGGGNNPIGTQANPNVVTGTFGFMKMFHPLLALYSIDRTMRGFGMVSSVAQAFTGALGSIWGAIGDTLLKAFEPELRGMLEASMKLLGWLEANWPKAVLEIRNQLSNAQALLKGGSLGDAFASILKDFMDMSPLGKAMEIGGLILAINLLERGIGKVVALLPGLLHALVYNPLRAGAIVGGAVVGAEGVRLATQESLAPRKEMDWDLAFKSAAGMGAAGATAGGLKAGWAGAAIGGAAGTAAGFVSSVTNQAISIDVSVQNVDEWEKARREIVKLIVQDQKKIADIIDSFSGR